MWGMRGPECVRFVSDWATLVLCLSCMQSSRQTRIWGHLFYPRLWVRYVSHGRPYYVFHSLSEVPTPCSDLPMRDDPPREATAGSEYCRVNIDASSGTYNVGKEDRLEY